MGYIKRKVTEEKKKTDVMWVRVYSIRSSSVEPEFKRASCFGMCLKVFPINIVRCPPAQRSPRQPLPNSSTLPPPPLPTLWSSESVTAPRRTNAVHRGSEFLPKCISSSHIPFVCRVQPIEGRSKSITTPPATGEDKLFLVNTRARYIPHQVLSIFH